MSISLPSNKEDKRARLDMLVKQGSIAQAQADQLYQGYCQLYNRVKTDNIVDDIKELSKGYLTR